MNARRASAPIAMMAALAVGATTAATVTNAKPIATAGQAGATAKPVLIETSIRFSENAPARGTIRRLFIGQRAYCTRARFEDGGSGQAVVKRIDCGRSGTLAIRFTPGPNAENVINQSGRWTLIGATGSFAGLKGGGTMFARFQPHGPMGNETFTGTLR
jgi:hypothetical protein